MSSTLNFLYFSSWALSAIFVPLIARQYTDNLFTVSLVVALYYAMILSSSMVFGRLGDILGQKIFVVTGFLLSAVVFLAHNLIHDIPSLFLIRVLAGLGAGMIPGPLAALAWSGSIGMFSAVGSLGNAAGEFMAGFLTSQSLIFITSALLCAAGFIIAFFVREKKKRVAVPLFPFMIIKKNLCVYVPFLIRHSSAQAIWAIFPIYLVGLGASKLWIGIIYALNPLLQFFFMLLINTRHSTSLIKLGLLFSSVTFLGYAVAPNWQVIIVLQILIAFSWANLYLGSLKYLLGNNVEQATAAGMLNSVIGLSGIIGPLFGGLISFMGIRFLIAGAALLAFFGFIVSRILKPQAEQMPLQQ